MTFSGISSVLPVGGSHSLIQLVFTECLLEPTAGLGAKGKREMVERAVFLGSTSFLLNSHCSV